MTLSMFDQQLFKLDCKCGKVTEEVLSNLDRVDSFSCPVCGHTVDLKTEPYRSVLKDLRRIATELDKQARQRGETIERIR